MSAGQHAPHRFPLVGKKVYSGHQLGNQARARAGGAPRSYSAFGSRCAELLICLHFSCVREESWSGGLIFHFLSSLLSSARYKHHMREGEIDEADISEDAKYTPAAEACSRIAWP